MNEKRRVQSIFSPEAEEQFIRLMERLTARVQQAVPSITELPTVPKEEWAPSKEDEEVINEFMDLMDEEIKKYAEDLIRVEVRDKIVSRGPQAINVIKEAIKKGGKPKLKRKKGCIFIQFGEGTPEDPIDELLIASI